MSMTREEIIKSYEDAVVASGLAAAAGNEEAAKSYELFKAGLSALRPVRRERIKQAWRGCSWCNNEGKKPENWECSLLDDDGFSVTVGSEVVWTNAEFCPVCGKPLSDEALEMVMKRLEAMKDADD